MAIIPFKVDSSDNQNKIIPFAMPQSTVAIAPQTEGSLLSGLKNLGGKIVGGAKNALETAIEKLGPVQVASKLEVGQPLSQAIATTYGGSREARLLESQMKFVNEGKSAKEAKQLALQEEAQNLAIGFIN